MATANLESLRFENINILTSLVIDEHNNAETNATTNTPTSGVFLTPSTVAGRPADISGYVAAAATELGKIEWISPATLGAGISLDDLSDVELTDPADTEYLVFDGTNWVNAAFPTIALDDLSDVEIAGVATNDILTYDGTNWVNSVNMTLSGNLTVEGAVSLGDAPTDTLGFYGATPVARPAVNTSAANFSAEGSGITDGTATYEGYTVGGIVLNLREIGLLT